MKTIKDLIKNFTDEAKKQGILLWYSNEYGVDTDICDWMPNAKVVNGDISENAITMLQKATTEKEMLETALKLPLSQAIERMTAELKNGYFSKNLKWLVIYLTDTNSEGVPLKLLCHLRGGRLRLYVNEVDPDDTWHVDGDDEVGFLSNDSKTLENGHLNTSETLSHTPSSTEHDTHIQEAITLLKAEGFKITREEKIIKEY